MKFKVDENLPLEVVVLLRSADHQAITIHEQQMTGEADPRITEVCQQEERALVTLDLDFANVRSYPPSILSIIRGGCGRSPDRATASDSPKN